MRLTIRCRAGFSTVCICGASCGLVHNRTMAKPFKWTYQGKVLVA